MLVSQVLFLVIALVSAFRAAVDLDDVSPAPFFTDLGLVIMSVGGFFVCQ